jgi:hypothetical protein
MLLRKPRPSRPLLPTVGCRAHTAARRPGRPGRRLCSPGGRSAAAGAPAEKGPGPTGARTQPGLTARAVVCRLAAASRPGPGRPGGSREDPLRALSDPHHRPPAPAPPLAPLRLALRRRPLLRRRRRRRVLRVRDVLLE